MTYAIQFFNAKVQAEIMAWPAGIQASFTRIAERMVDYGPNLGMPYTRPFGDGLFDILARGVEGIGRAFFCTLVDPGGPAHRHPARLHQEDPGDPRPGIEAGAQANERGAT